LRFDGLSAHCLSCACCMCPELVEGLRAALVEGHDLALRRAQRALLIVCLLYVP
jgi:hypothetical protein